MTLRAKAIVRLAGRLGLVAVAAVVAAMVGIQFAGIVAKDVAVASEVEASHARIVALRAREAAQLRTIRRLSTPRGAIPEIHEKLRFVGPNEELIYVRNPPAEPRPSDHSP